MVQIIYPWRGFVNQKILLMLVNPICRYLIHSILEEKTHFLLPCSVAVVSSTLDWQRNSSVVQRKVAFFSEGAGEIQEIKSFRTYSINAVNYNQMQNGGSNETSTTSAGYHSSNVPEPDLEKQGDNLVLPQEERLQGSVKDSACEAGPTLLTIVVTKGESHVTQQPVAQLSKDVDCIMEELPRVAPQKGFFSRSTSSDVECRVCQQEKEEGLIDLGCQCKGGLSKAHRSCIDKWFRAKGSNKCEICQAVAVNVSSPESQPSTNYWVWRVDPSFTPHERQRGCYSPLWVAFSILIDGLILDVLISVTLGVSALPVNIIIGVIVVLGLGTALRLALEFCHEWSIRRAVQRVEANAALGHRPAL